MSIATLTGPAAGPRREASDACQWITLAEAARILGVHPTTIQRAALAGSIRHRTIRGTRVRYHRDDVTSLVS